MPKDIPQISNISYSTSAFENPQDLVDTAAMHLKNIDYDTLIGTGLSGSLVIPTLAYWLDKHYAIIRKPGDGSHAYKGFEGHIGKRWIFVDDFIATSGTLRRVINDMNNITAQTVTEYNPSTGFYYLVRKPRLDITMVGAYTYEGHDDYCPKFRTVEKLKMDICGLTAIINSNYGR